MKLSAALVVSCVLVVAGAAPADRPATDLAAAVAERERAGQPRKEAIAEVARVQGVPKRRVYDAVVTAKG
jgi:16S rRNA (cytidine1402-2'-O)-methyltransferase